MRIGFGVTHLARGLLTGQLDGIGVYSECLWHEFVNRGHDAHAVAFGTSETVKKDPRSPSSLTCVDGSYSIQAARSLLSGLPFRGTGHFSEKFDVFHATDHHIPKLHGVPVVATIMDAIPFIHPEWTSNGLRWVKNKAFRKAGHWAEHIITISEFSKYDVMKAFGFSEQNISVIPLGYDESFKQRATEAQRMDVLHQYGLRDGYFISVGTLQPRKNLRRVIEAHRSLGAERQIAHPLVIVGSYGWGDDELLRDIGLMEQLGYARWLRGVPHDDLVVLLQSAKALVYPSLYEGFGLPVLEGFASGIPVISSNTTSIPEVAGDAALLINPLDVEELSYAMREVVENEDLVLNLVQRGYERLEQFSWSSCARHTLRVYESVM